MKMQKMAKKAWSLLKKFIVKFYSIDMSIQWLLLKKPEKTYLKWLKMKINDEENVSIYSWNNYIKQRALAAYFKRRKPLKEEEETENENQLSRKLGERKSRYLEEK